MKRLFRTLYGESPLHLLALLASFAVCGYALARLLEGDWWGIVQWTVGAALLHDLVLVPLYGGTDWLLHKAVLARRRTSPPRVAVVNHIRVPAFVSLLLLLVYWPVISQGNDAHYEAATALTPGVFFPRWLAITAVLFSVSAALLVLRTWRASHGTRRTNSGNSRQARAK